jgi:hypothetical protein
MSIAISINKIPIRLTQERWQHISVGHPEIAEYYFEILETIQFLIDIITRYHNDKVIGLTILHVSKRGMNV